MHISTLLGAKTKNMNNKQFTMIASRQKLCTEMYNAITNIHHL